MIEYKYSIIDFGWSEALWLVDQDIKRLRSDNVDTITVTVTKDYITLSYNGLAK